MHAAPRSAREIGEGMEFSSIVINSIVSGTAAALVSGVFQLVDTRNGSDYRRRQYFDSRKVDEYFVALEAYSTLVNSLYDLGAAMSGRKSPDGCEELDEKQKMIDRDRRGGAKRSKLRSLPSGMPVWLRLAWIYLVRCVQGRTSRVFKKFMTTMQEK